MKRISIHIAAVLVLLTFPFATNAAPSAVEGIVDLRNWNFEQDGLAKLDGDWEFYWQQHVAPENFTAMVDAEFSYQTVPDSWSEENSKGFATYRLNILLPDQEHYALKLPDFSSAYRLYIDGSPVVEVGTAGIDESSTEPRFYPTTVDFVPSSPRIELVVHLSNYDYRTGGMWLTPYIGYKQQVEQVTETARSLDLLLIGAIIMIGLYNLVLFSLRPSDPAGLFLGLFCLVLSVRLLSVGERVLARLFTDIPFDTYIKIEYISWYVAIATFGGFLRCVLPNEFSRLASSSIYVVVTVATLIALVAPPETTSSLVTPMQVFTVLCQIYAIWIFCLGLLRKREGAIILATAYLALFVATANDIMVNNGLIDGTPLLGPSLIIFVMIQSFLLSYRFAQSFRLIEQQRVHLEAANISLRTQEKLRLQAENTTEALRGQVDDSRRLKEIGELFAQISTPAQLSKLTKATPGLLSDLRSLLISSEITDEVDINRLVFEAIRSHPQILVDLEPTLPLIKSNEADLQRMIENFLGYTASENDRRVTVATRLETLEAKPLFFGNISAGKYIVVSVANTVRHIEDLELELLLEPVGHPIDVEIGFGLYIVKNLIAKMQGGIDVLPHDQSGFLFELYIPLS